MNSANTRRSKVMDKKGFILTAVVLILFALYLPIDSARSKVYSFKTIIDDFIPLSTPFIVIYLSYFGFLIATFIYFIRTKKRVILHTILLAIIIACSVSYLIYFLLQNSVERPLIENKSIFDFMYSWINTVVPPYNAFPSLHVAISIICSIGYFAAKSIYKKWLAFWVFLIIISTVTTKQHYFLDIIGGIFLAMFSYKTSKSIISRE